MINHGIKPLIRVLAKEHEALAVEARKVQYFKAFLTLPPIPLTKRGRKFQVPSTLAYAKYETYIQELRCIVRENQYRAFDTDKGDLPPELFPARGIAKRALTDLRKIYRMRPHDFAEFEKSALRPYRQYLLRRKIQFAEPLPRFYASVIHHRLNREMNRIVNPQ